MMVSERKSGCKPKVVVVKSKTGLQGANKESKSSCSGRLDSKKEKIKFREEREQGRERQVVKCIM